MLSVLAAIMLFLRPSVSATPPETEYMPSNPIVMMVCIDYYDEPGVCYVQSDYNSWGSWR